MPDGGEMMRHTEIVPGPDTARDFRTALGQFSTGVTVVTAMAKNGPIGITANSFASVSLDPPLVMWCPAKRSKRFPHFAAATHFSIHVLAADQRSLAQRFAVSGGNFDGLTLDATAEGVPVLERCLARFDCKLEQCHDAGDHAIIVGLVTRAIVTEGDALVFSRGKFGIFSDV